MKQEFLIECLDTFEITRTADGYQVDGKTFKPKWEDITCREIADQIADYAKYYYKADLSTGDVINFLRDYKPE